MTTDRFMGPSPFKLKRRPRDPQDGRQCNEAYRVTAFYDHKSLWLFALRLPLTYLMRLGGRTRQVEKLLSFAELLQGELRLRIGAHQMPARVRDAEKRIVDLEPD